jgi:hypothetical protein
VPMSEPILCKRCGQRRPKRACPALHADICAICCGTEREVSLSCPLECEHLREAHLREKSLPVDSKDAVHKDVEVTEEFIREREELLLFCIYSLLNSSLRVPGAVDTDALAALEALIKTYRTAESGLIYESRAENTVAAAVQKAFASSLADYQNIRAEREDDLAPLRDKEILGILVFLARFGQQNLNGRPKGRLFLDVLSRMTPPERIDEREPSIIL